MIGIFGSFLVWAKKKSLKNLQFDKFYNFAAFWFDFGFVRLWLLVELTQISIMLVLPRWFESLGRWFSHLLGSFPMARTFDNHIQALTLKSKWSLTAKCVIFIWSWVFCAFFMLPPRKIMHFQRFNDICGTSNRNTTGTNIPSNKNWRPRFSGTKPLAFFTMPQPLSLQLLPVFFWPWAFCAGPCGKVHWKDGCFCAGRWLDSLNGRFLTQLHFPGLPNHFPDEGLSPTCAATSWWVLGLL